MFVWKKGNLRKLPLCYSIVYHYIGAQRYEQFLQVSRLYRGLILLSLAIFRAPLYLHLRIHSKFFVTSLFLVS